MHTYWMHSCGKRRAYWAHRWALVHHGEIEESPWKMDHRMVRFPKRVSLYHWLYLKALRELLRNLHYEYAIW